MVADRFQPLPLLGGELAAIRFLLRHPLGKVLVDIFAERVQVALLVHGEAHQRNQVGEDALPRAAHLGAVERLVGLPEAVGGPGPRRALDGFRQFLNLLEREPLLVRAAVENLQRGDLVLVLAR